MITQQYNPIEPSKALEATRQLAPLDQRSADQTRPVKTSVLKDAYKSQSHELSREEKDLMLKVNNECRLKVRVLTGEVNGIPRCVILFGECHVQSRENAIYANKILKLSWVRVLEGWKPENIIEKAAKSLYAPIRVAMGIGLGAVNLVGQFAKLPWKKFHKTDPKTDKESKILNQSDPLLYGSNIDISKRAAETDLRIINIKGETGRKPDIVHSIGLLAFTSATSLGLASFAGIGIFEALAFPGLGSEPILKQIGLFVFGISAGLATVLGSFRRKENFLKRVGTRVLHIFIDSIGLGSDREAALQANILNALSNNNEMSRIMLITGAVHTNRVFKRLMENGFKEITPL